MIITRASSKSHLFNTNSGEYGERRLDHMEEAGQFYRDLRARGIKARIGMEASGHTGWFEQLIAEMSFELC